MGPELYRATGPSERVVHRNCPLLTGLVGFQRVCSMDKTDEPVTAWQVSDRVIDNLDVLEGTEAAEAASWQGGVELKALIKNWSHPSPLPGLHEGTERP